MPIPSQDYESGYPFVLCVPVFLVLPLNFRFEFSRKSVDLLFYIYVYYYNICWSFGESIFFFWSSRRSIKLWWAGIRAFDKPLHEYYWFIHLIHIEYLLIKVCIVVKLCSYLSIYLFTKIDSGYEENYTYLMITTQHE